MDGLVNELSNERLYQWNVRKLLKGQLQAIDLESQVLSLFWKVNNCELDSAQSASAQTENNLLLVIFSWRCMARIMVIWRGICSDDPGGIHVRDETVTGGRLMFIARVTTDNTLSPPHRCLLRLMARNCDKRDKTEEADPWDDRPSLAPYTGAGSG